MLVLLFVLLVLIATASRQVLAIVFVFTLALAVAASELWGRFGLTNLRYRRHLDRNRISFGEETSLTLEFVNAKPLPLAWVLVYDEYPQEVSLLTGQVRQARPKLPPMLVSMLSLRWYERVTRIHRIRGDHRGVYRFGPAEVISGDMFTPRRQRRGDAGVDTLVVYPKVVPVHVLGLPVGRPMGEWLARRRIIEDPLRFATVREYSPGDNPRFIHWKATARQRALQVKVFDPSDTLSLTLGVDVQTATNPYECVPEYLELIISAAASLAVHALGERHMVGLCTNDAGLGGYRGMRIKRGRHPQQVTQILTTLASLGSFRGMPFEHMLRTLISSLPLGATVVTITALPRGPIYEALAALKEAGHPVLLLTVGDTEANVPDQITSYHLGGRDAWHRLEALELA